MEKKEEELFSLAEYDPTRVKELYQMPAVEYYLLLDNRVKMDKIQARNNKK